MRIILDTNVLASGVFFSGPPYVILDVWRNKEAVLVISPEIYQEYEDIIRDIHEHHPNVDINHFLSLILHNSEMCRPNKLPCSVTQDPKDEKFIACAVTVNVKVIVSGDKHLLGVSGYNGIEILSPRQFLQKYLNPQGF